MEQMRGDARQAVEALFIDGIEDMQLVQRTQPVGLAGWLRRCLHQQVALCFALLRRSMASLVTAMELWISRGSCESFRAA